MGLSSRYYLFADDGVHRVAQRVIEGLVHGRDALPKYAGTTQKAATITIENDDKGVARIVSAEGAFFRFDEVGKINKSLREASRAAIDNLPVPAPTDQQAVVDLSVKLKRKKWEKEHRGELSKADLDLIAADLRISGFADNGPRLQAVESEAPKHQPLTYEARDALAEISSKLFQIDIHLSKLNERALKGVTHEARQRAQDHRDEPLWSGVAELADRKREILARHRTGKGIWYAVIEGLQEGHGFDSGEIFDIAFVKCESLKAAEVAARQLLIEHAAKFSRGVGIEPHVYCELEWSPPE